MPVPVPRFSKQSAHPIVKQNQSGAADHRQPSVFQNLTCTLPLSPTGPPPSFGTREEWINSLPSWRRAKPRRIWEDDIRIAEGRRDQDFTEGLTLAGNASVIKGAHAQACIPPLFTLTRNPVALMPPAPPREACDSDADDEMSSDCSGHYLGQHDTESQWSASSPIDVDVERQPRFDVSDNSAGIWLHNATAAPSAALSYERGAFTPVFEDESPGMASPHDASSSPILPITPFGEYVDRAVAAEKIYTHHGVAISKQDYQSPYAAFVSRLVAREASQQMQEIPLAPEPVVTPSATSIYRKLAEPLSEWLASYVWKMCTTGMSLPIAFTPLIPTVNTYSSSPPSYLAGSIHSLLLSTLLQPSAIFLAVWYVVRLPVFFGTTRLGPDHVKELCFRVELLGDITGTLDKEIVESHAPFRLILLGCMLANKWLDDHTFSNKTWHTISNVPIQSLNKLESLALDVFNHDLSVPPKEWSRWLAHLLSYHAFIVSPGYPQPISRPSTNPQAIIRKTLEELIQASSESDGVTPLPRVEPVFLGLEQRRQEKYEKDDVLGGDVVDVLEIDLDEDGPLREEYLPKRRIRAGSSQSIQMKDFTQFAGPEWTRVAKGGRFLPPPAKWSPAGDEPLYRVAHRPSGRYVAVQPPVAHHFFGIPDTLHHIQEVDRYRGFAPAGIPLVSKPGGSQQQEITFGQRGAPLNPYQFAAPIHSRSHSLCYDQDNHSRNHIRSYSQSRFDNECGDIRMMASENGSMYPSDSYWPVADQHGQLASYSHPFASRTNLDPQAQWLRI